MEHVHQGDILKIEKIKHPVLVASKDFFNTSGEILGCPIIKESVEGPLHIWISADETNGYVQCEKLALLDLSGHSTCFFFQHNLFTFLNYAAKIMIFMLYNINI